MTAVAVVASCLLSACGSTPKPRPVIVEGTVSEAWLPVTTRIVADEGATYLAGFSVDAMDRQDYIRQFDTASGNAYTGYATSQLADPRTMIFLPLGLIIDSANAYRRGEQRLRDAGVAKPISDEDGERLAALFQDRATSAALTKHVVLLKGPSSRDLDYPRLTIRVDTIELQNLSRGRFFRVIAYAQAHTGPYTALPRTVHSSSFTYHGDGPTKRGIDAMLVALGQSIMVTYFPNHPYSVEYLHWERVSRSFDPEEVRTYIDQYPEGRFAEPARAQLAQATKWVEEKPRRERRAAEAEARKERAAAKDRICAPADEGGQSCVPRQ